MDINTLIKSLPEKCLLSTLLNQKEYETLLTITGNPDLMIVDKAAVIIIGEPVTIQGVPGMFTTNALTDYKIDVHHHSEGTILKFIQDDKVHYGITCRQDGQEGVFLELRSRVNEDSFRAGKLQKLRTHFVLIGETNIVHNHAGIISAISDALNN